jgi:hypothetical protein
MSAMDRFLGRNVASWNNPPSVVSTAVHSRPWGHRDRAHRRSDHLPLFEAAKFRHVRIHDLRHTYVSLLFAAGKEIHYV